MSLLALFILRKRSIKLLHKTSVLCQPIDSYHVENIKLSLKPLSKQTPNREQRKKTTALRQKHMPFTSASSTSFTPNLHHHHTDRWSRMILKKKEFSSCPLLPPLGLCRPLLAQTSTTPHTEAHRHRGHRSCAWSLETYRTRREPQSKGLFFMIFLFPQFVFLFIYGYLWVYGFFWSFMNYLWFFFSSIFWFQAHLKSKLLQHL